MEDNQPIVRSIIVGLLLLALHSLSIEYAWNYTITEIFGVVKITFVQALLLKILSHLLLKIEV
jgi:hypothetical protein